jgi:Aspartyl protease
MPTVSGELSSNRRFLITDVWVLPVGDEGLHYNGPKAEAKALMDTGCNVTSISSRIVDDLGFERSVKGPPVNVLGGKVSHTFRHLIWIAFPSGLQIDVFPTGVLAVEPVGVDSDPEFEVHIGMDVLSFGALNIANGRFTFTF